MVRPRIAAISGPPLAEVAGLEDEANGPEEEDEVPRLVCIRRVRGDPASEKRRCGPPHDLEIL